MSEEILKALMQLFALIVKQGKGVQQKEIDFVRSFLTEQLNEITVVEYMEMFAEFADLHSPDSNDTPQKSPSVKDSVRIFAICKKINRTLTQTQKVIVLIRLFELVNSNKMFTVHRMTIINTVAEVFNIPVQEFKDIEFYVKQENPEEGENPNFLVVDKRFFQSDKIDHKLDFNTNHRLYILQIPSVGIYLLKHMCLQVVLLNGLEVKPAKIYVLPRGSSIRLPTGRSLYFSDINTKFHSSSELVKTVIEVKHLSFDFPNGIQGLHDINFTEHEGRLVGIMGASGTGKSTLLNLLSGVEKPTKGSVLVNRLNLHADEKSIKGLVGYIPQDDLLIEELTVFENLYYNAKLCFGQKSEIEILSRVNETLENLSLSDQKDLKVGSLQKKILSGGQRKRLNIALELIREPALLFVDEPTSGLSSRDSENVMDLLRDLSLKGKMIFVVIHQPSSDLYKMFDNILILDEGGRMIYYGNPVEAVVYFKKLDAQINSDIGECATCGNVNPEQIFNIVDKKVVDEYGRYTSKRKVSPEKWEDIFNHTRQIHHYTLPDESPPFSLKVPSWFKQFKIFTIRDSLSKISNAQYILLNLLEAPILGFILSYIIYYIADPQSNVYIFRENENIPIYIFMSLIVALFVALTVSAEEIYRDRKILKRERFLNLNKGSYLISKILILFFISAIQSYLFLIIGNSILAIKGMNFYYWMALFTTAAFANLLGLNISASFNSAITIYIVIPLIIIPMMVLSGAMFSFDKLNRNIGSVDKVPGIAEFMATRWTYEGLMVHQFISNKFEKYYYALEKSESENDFIISQKIPFLRKSVNKLVSMLNEGNLNPGPELELLKNEINLEQTKSPTLKFTEYEMLNRDSLSIDLVNALYNYLDNMELYFGEQLAEKDAKIDNITQYMLGKDPQKYRSLKDQYYNESVADFVKKRFERNRLLVYKNRIIQNYQPIYQNPSSDKYFGFRTHFFAPKKYFFGTYFDTFWFNMSVVWFMTIIMFITLYFDLLKKTISFFEHLNLKKNFFRLSKM